MNAKVLVIDDEKTFRMVAEAALVGEGYQFAAAATGRAGLERARAFAPDIVVLDRNLPDIDGLSLLPILRAEATSRGEEPVVIMATAYAEVENAVQALKAGAQDYLIKPLHLPDLLLTVARALENKRLRRRVDDLSGQSRRRVERAMCIGESQAMQRVLGLVDKIAASADTTVLISGETGTGKELVAHLIHARTKGRGDAAFVELNCAAVPETLLESEIFGHERGAFTDAKAAKRGLLEEADGGTLFLDEIGDMALATQAKLLKVLETQRFRRLGGGRDIQIDVRFMAATHRDLPAAVDAGAFRLDLYHRLDVFQIRLPALRDRAEDILPLARFFLQEFGARGGRSLPRFSPEAEAKLGAYQFPGNVRELRNIIERAVILESSAEIQAEALVLRDPRRGGMTAREARDVFADSLAERGRPPTLDEVEKEYLVKLLEHTDGNRTQVARLMGVSYPTVMKKIGDYAIDLARWPRGALS
ncbi:MAG: sigma-54 dependent transcriptional regulator [Pseudomonadota bacterium]